MTLASIMSIGALVAIFATSFLVSLTGALSPGPLTTLAVREGVPRGLWAGPALAAGHGAIELALGLNRLLDEEWLTATIALVGGTFLLWLGAQIIRTAPQQGLVIGERGDDKEPPPVRRGGADATYLPRPSPGSIQAGLDTNSLSWSAGTDRGC